MARRRHPGLPRRCSQAAAHGEVFMRPGRTTSSPVGVWGGGRTAVRVAPACPRLGSRLVDRRVRVCPPRLGHIGSIGDRRALAVPPPVEDAAGARRRTTPPGGRTSGQVRADGCRGWTRAV